MRIRTGALRNTLVLFLPLIALSACFLTPFGQGPNGTQPVVAAGRPNPATLAVKLYPSNDLANQTGVLTVQVAILMIGRGRFTFDYQGETLVGEATRVANDYRRGVASAYGQSGMFARCEYQMSSPRMSGTCAFSNGARYLLHVGS